MSTELSEDGRGEDLSARGLAHDLNHLLMLIATSSDRLLHCLPTGDPLHAPLLEIKRNALRAGTITHGLGDAAQAEMQTSRVRDLNFAVARSEDLLREIAGPTVHVRLSLHATDADVSIAPSSFERLLLNLALNARDAMAEGGTLLVETCDDDASQYSRGGVILRVCDSGRGMSVEQRARALETSFTSKVRGSGAGLGLSIVRDIVERTGGQVRIDSTVGAGTSVECCFPRQRRDSGLRPRATSPLTHVSETDVSSVESRESSIILVVDDSPDARAAYQELLQSEGFVVLTARNAGDASELFRAHAARVSAVVTDFTFAEARGVALAAKLRELRPDLSIVHVAGFALDDPTLRSELGQPRTALLTKPIEMSALAALLRETGSTPVAAAIASGGPS